MFPDWYCDVQWKTTTRVQLCRRCHGVIVRVPPLKQNRPSTAPPNAMQHADVLEREKTDGVMRFWKSYKTNTWQEDVLILKAIKHGLFILELEAGYWRVKLFALNVICFHVRDVVVPPKGPGWLNKPIRSILLFSTFRSIRGGSCENRILFVPGSGWNSLQGHRLVRKNEWIEVFTKRTKRVLQQTLFSKDPLADRHTWRTRWRQVKNHCRWRQANDCRWWWWRWWWRLGCSAGLWK